MKLKYLIIYKYTRDINKSFRYDSTAEAFLQYIDSKIYSISPYVLEDVATYYYDKIMDVAYKYIEMTNDDIIFEDTSFVVNIYLLHELHELVDNIIIQTPVTQTSQTLAYSGELSEMVEFFGKK